MPLFQDVWDAGERYPVWMSHGDRITRMPPGFEAAAHRKTRPMRVIADQARRYYGLMFHPEVIHTPHGAALIRNFVRKIAGLRRRLVDEGVPRGGHRPHPRSRSARAG